MPPVPQLNTVLIAIAVIFLAQTLRDVLRAEGKLTPARKTWLLIAFMFSAVAIVLYVLQLL